MNLRELNNKRIFYIEDDIFNRSIVQTILERYGVKFWFDRWGKEQTIQRLLKFQPVDLILLDLMLPDGVTGYDIYAEILNTPALADIPAIIVSAADPSIEMPKARQLGINGYISKPIDVMTFPRYLVEFFQGESVWVANQY